MGGRRPLAIPHHVDALILVTDEYPPFRLRA